MATRRDSEWQQNFDWQQTMAKHGIKMRVEDAKSAGVHPLYALGANTPSSYPVQSIQGGRSGGMPGQNIGRSQMATMTKEERAARLENQTLQNDLLKTQINAANNPPMPPARGTTAELPPEASLTPDTTGGYQINPSINTSQSQQNDRWGQWSWFMRNRLQPFLKPQMKRNIIIKGKEYRFNGRRYVPVKKPRPAKNRYERGKMHKYKS